MRTELDIHVCITDYTIILLWDQGFDHALFPVNCPLSLVISSSAKVNVLSNFLFI
jgi:hypothetical protein